ncbi:hypothetical protein HMPREF9346_05355 [Escherichia coli MS 119-7]|nr:hypothetical protein HMPREF9346_05355 [Escherichia coli MS 119-7]
MRKPMSETAVNRIIKRTVQDDRATDHGFHRTALYPRPSGEHYATGRMTHRTGRIIILLFKEFYIKQKPPY